MAEFWESDEIIAPAPAAAPAAPAAASVAVPAPAAAATSAPAAAADSFWAKDEIVSPAPVPAAAVPNVPAPEPGKPERSVLGEIGHQVGLTARAAVQGAAALPGVVSDAITGPINAGLDTVAGEGNGFRFQKLSSALGNIMDQTGVAKPENATERVVQDAATGAATALTGVGAGQVVAKAAGPITKAVGNALAAAPTAQAVSGATGGGAAGVTRESGGGAVAQTVAGLAGALAPTAVPYAAQAGVRGALRGGEATRQRMVDNIATFEEAAGTTPTLGQATQSRAAQGAETGLSNVIGGSGVMIRKGEQQAKALQDSVQKITESLSPNASGVDAGEAISRGVNTFRDNVRATQQRLYNALDKHIAPDAPITVSNTRTAMQELNAGIDGAENLSAWFRNARLNDLEKSLVADLEKAAAAQAQAGARSGLTNAQGPNLNTAALPYESIKKMRTLVGREMSDANFTSEINRDKWSKLYAALSEDLGATAKAAGPQAEQAWSRANTFTRLASERMEQISSIVNRDAPEKIFKAATTGLADGGTQINRLMKSMPVENRREVAAAVLQRLGRARPGQQNEIGDAFSSETFLTNLANLSAPARKALFNTSGFPGLEQRIAQMGRMASVRREGSQVFANPSGTARQAGLFGWVAALGSAIATGNAAGIAGAIAVPVGAKLAAKVATSPQVVRFAAGKSEVPQGLAASTIAAASRTAQPTDNGKGAIMDGGKPFQNRLKAGRVAREQGGTVMPAPNGGFVVLRGAAR
ncbi:hypothetical protein [Variovorax sp. AFSI2.2]|uniref:hypothetical protein n=1 Tax=Variovorax sp. AFSI2.2 TaxID=3384160 RepID=UPI003EB715D7